MLVKIGTYTLVGGTRATGMGVRWERLSAGRGVEVYYPVRGAAKTRDSGNDVTDVAFAVSREFETIEEAETFLADHPVDVPRSGLIQFISKRSNGQELVRYLRDGRVMAVELVEHTGVHVVHRYSITGGVYTRTRPSS